MAAALPNHGKKLQLNVRLVYGFLTHSLDSVQNLAVVHVKGSKCLINILDKAIPHRASPDYALKVLD